MARPVEYTPEKLAEIEQAFLQYIAENDIPIVAEFAYISGIRRTTLYDHPELSNAIKACIDKKEAALEKLGLEGKVNSSMAIFSLKQLGWKDKHEIEHSGDIVVKGFPGVEVDA